MPFEKLVEELSPERSLAQHAALPGDVLAPEPPGRRAEIPGLAFAPSRRRRRHRAKFDLTLVAPRPEEGLGLALEYRTALFDAATIRRTLSHFATLLAGIAAGPETRLSELPLLPEAERWQVLSEWSRIEAVFPRRSPSPRVRAAGPGDSGSFGARLRGREPDLPRSWTSGPTGSPGSSAGWASVPEVPVGLFLDRSTGRIVATLAVVKAGGAYVPLDPAHPAERLALHPGGHRRAPWSLRTRACSRRSRRAPPRSSAWTGRRSGRRVGEPLDSGVSVDSLLYVMYTSGSTGTPKGVAVVHRGVSASRAGAGRGRGFGPRGRRPPARRLFLRRLDARSLGNAPLRRRAGRPFPGSPARSKRSAGKPPSHGATVLWLTTGLFHQMAEGAWRRSPVSG